MSLGINTTTPEGIVLAADSRQSYINHKGVSRIGSDSASKVFQLTERVGVIVAGLAFLQEGGVQKNISRFIEDFRITHDLKKINVAQISTELENYFKIKYDYKQQLAKISSSIKANLTAQGAEIISLEEKDSVVVYKFKDSAGVEKNGTAGVDQLHFIVAGFNLDDSHQTAMVYVPGKTEISKDSNLVGREYGANWIGQTDLIVRMVLGYDGRMERLPFINKAITDLGPEQIKAQLAGLEYVIQWGTMTLQDGIDFSILAIETTTAIQRFSDGIKANPGDMPGVGGSIDVAVITREKGFVWISKKKLRAGDSIVDLEKVTNLP